MMALLSLLLPIRTLIWEPREVQLLIRDSMERCVAWRKRDTNLKWIATDLLLFLCECMSFLPRYQIVKEVQKPTSVAPPSKVLEVKNVTGLTANIGAVMFILRYAYPSLTNLIFLPLKSHNYVGMTTLFNSFYGAWAQIIQLFLQPTAYSHHNFFLSEFTPILRGYIVSGYRENELLKHPIQSPVLVEENLVNLKPVTDWDITYNQGSGIYEIKQV